MHILKGILVTQIIDHTFGTESINQNLSGVLVRMVGRDGIEPPTRGFSVLCSTD
jgi:hypothetical protein